MLVPYQHKQLLGSRKIRIFKLKPYRGKKLQCELKEISLDAAPPYEALSYACGSPATVGQIFCDHALIGITANCESALRALRGRISSRWLWVDAICINQKDVAEKNLQIRLMSEIYPKARRVVV